MTIGIPVFCVLFATGLVWFLLDSRVHWLIKGLFTSCVLYSTVLLGASIPSIYGWPSNTEPPADTKIIWIDITEPSEVLKDYGAIRIWARPKYEKTYIHSLFGIEPRTRLYTIEYDEETKKAAKQAMQKIKDGKDIAYRAKGKQQDGGGGNGAKARKNPGSPKSGSGKPGSGDNRKGNGGNKGQGESWKGHEIELFYELPNPLPPMKNE